MGRLTEMPFKESCCDGGQVCSTDSAQPCGCDPKAGWTCEVHKSKDGMWGKVLTTGGSTVTKASGDYMASNYEIRKFETGATRDQDQTKHDFEGFLSPLVIDRFGQYMTKHRQQPDGQMRASDNWQLGIPIDAYMKSGWRHFFDWWKQHRGIKGQELLEDTLCALMFNTMGYLHELLKRKQ